MTLFLSVLFLVFTLTQTKHIARAGQLAWLIYIMGATIGARIGVAPSQTDEHDTIDGELSYRVFQLMQLHDQRVMAVY